MCVNRANGRCMRQKTITNTTIFLIVFAVLFQFNSGIIIQNMGIEHTRLALIGFFIPVVYGVFKICTGEAKLPIVMKWIAFLSASFFFVHELFTLTLKFAYLFNGELNQNTYIYQSLPYLIWLIYTILLEAKLVNLIKLRKIYIRFIYLQIVGIIIALLIEFILTFIGWNGSYQLVNTGPHIISLLMMAVPFSYLVFFEFDGKKFSKPYLLAIYSSIALTIVLTFNANGTVVTTHQEHEVLQYLEAIFRNYPLIIAYGLELLDSLVKFFTASFIYIIVFERLNRDNRVNTRRTFGINYIIISVIYLILLLVSNNNINTYFINQQSVVFAFQLIYIWIVVFYGFFLGLKKYDRFWAKLCLFQFPSFLVLYTVYNLQKIWPSISDRFINFIVQIDHVLLYFSIFVLLFYTFETLLLMFAYTQTKVTEEIEVDKNDKEHHIYVMVPCMNEELVIGNTLTSLLYSEYKNLNVIVIDDGSEDGTADVVNSFSDSRLRLIQRVKPNAQQGKGEALNYVYAMLRDEIKDIGIDFNDVLISIIDADTILPLKYFEKVNHVFAADSEVTGLQSKVRVISSNRDKAQDLEFANIINATQALRMMTNTVAFGGNGQFCKLSITEKLDNAPWSKSLVEDFDLSTRILLHKEIEAKHVQFDDIYIVQSGIEDDLEALVKQRVRWSQGNIQSWKYIPQIITSMKLDLAQKFELLMTLVKPWLMGMEYLIVVFTTITLIDVFIVSGVNRIMIVFAVMLFISLIYITIINTIWAFLYNQKKPGGATFKSTVNDAYYLTKFLFSLSQIYPQAAIRHFSNQNGWDKTKRQINKM